MIIVIVVLYILVQVEVIADTLHTNTVISVNNKHRHILHITPSPLFLNKDLEWEQNAVHKPRNIPPNSHCIHNQRDTEQGAIVTQHQRKA